MSFLNGKYYTIDTYWGLVLLSTYQSKLNEKVPFWGCEKLAEVQSYDFWPEYFRIGCGYRGNRGSMYYIRAKIERIMPNGLSADEQKRFESIAQKKCYYCGCNEFWFFSEKCKRCGKKPIYRVLFNT